MKLLQNDQLRKQKNRASQIMQSNQAEELAAKLKEDMEQKEITEEKDADKKSASDDDSKSSDSEEKE